MVFFYRSYLNRKMKHAAYLLNPFEMEAYRRMHDIGYLQRCDGGAKEWRVYAKMPMNQRLSMYQNNHKQK